MSTIILYQTLVEIFLNYFFKLNSVIIPYVPICIILVTYVLCLEDVFFSRQSVFHWVLTVLPLSPTLFVRDRLHTGASEEKRKEVW